MEQEKLLQRISEILDKLKIPYSVTGGMAVSVWGRPRFTADIDVIIELIPQKLDQLAEELLRVDKDVYVSQEAMEEALATKGEFNFIHPASGLKVDFWILKNDLFSLEQIRRRKAKKIGISKIYFISPEDLILSKLLLYQISHSDRQLEDIASVIKFQKKLDWKYLRKWAKQQETDDILNGLKEKKIK